MSALLLASPADERPSADDRDVDVDPDAPETPLERAVENTRRREILHVLCETDDGTPLCTLATRIASQDHYLPDVIASLHDLHLPKLVEDDLVDHASGEGVALRIDRERAKAALRGASDDE